MDTPNRWSLTDSRTAPTNESALSPARACCVPAPDRSGRTCDKPRGHDGPHWTYGGNTLTWPATTASTNEVAPPNQADEDPVMVAEVTAIVRAADAAFTHSGGSSRHWVRECFLPALNHGGWMVVETSTYRQNVTLLPLRAEMEQWLHGEGPHADQPAPVHLWADQLARLDQVKATVFTEKK